MNAPQSLAIAAIVAFGCGEPPEPPPPAQVGPDAGTVAVDNAQLGYVVEGTGRPCIVFGSRIYYPRTFSDSFKQRFRCAHVDQRGFVPTAKAPSTGRYDVATAVADIEAVRNHLGYERIVLIGHSMHGTVAMAYGLAHPDRVIGVIAIGAPAGFDTSLVTGATQYWDHFATEDRKTTDQRNLARISADSLQRLAPGEALVTTYVLSAARYWADSTYDASWLWAGVQPNVGMVSQLFDFARPYRLPTGGQSATPVLLALGRFDFVVPPTLWDQRTTPFTRLTTAIFEESGHTPQLEEPSAFDARVAEWLDSIDP